MKKSFGKYIASKRVEAELSLREVADRMNFSHVHYGEIERGKRKFDKRHWKALSKIIPSIEYEKLCELTSGQQEVPPEMLDLVRFLANLISTWSKLRYEALSLPYDECREFLAMKFPVLQGLQSSIDLEKIGQQEFDKDKLYDAVQWLLKEREGK